jgi:hypothetical protein
VTEGAKKQFFADRVRAMATVVLTRRDDLGVEDTKQSTGIDYHVYIDREDKSMRLGFGILLRAIDSPMTQENANAVLRPTMGQFQAMRKFTYPVCLFFFTMREQQAYFSWLAEPVVTAAGPKLVHHTAADCVELTHDVLDQVVERVVIWYDAVESVLIA